jgi:hypothetical protein
MTSPFVQVLDPGTLLVGVVMAALLITVAALAWRGRRRRLRAARAEATAGAPGADAEKPPALDFAALTAAVGEAEAVGQVRRLPGLYLSLAEWRLKAGETGIAEELLRKSIRGATSAGLKDTHAKARVALGDIAHAGGDLATACEHWQIARSLFYELRQVREHDAIDARMRRNGCPTDWVLTDF